MKPRENKTPFCCRLSKRTIAAIKRVAKHGISQADVITGWANREEALSKGDNVIVAGKVVGILPFERTTDIQRLANRAAQLRQREKTRDPGSNASGAPIEDEIERSE